MSKLIRRPLQTRTFASTSLDRYERLENRQMLAGLQVVGQLDFDSQQIPYTTSGPVIGEISSGPWNDYYRLSDTNGDGYSLLSLDRLVSGPQLEIEIEFDFRIGDHRFSNHPADGIAVGIVKTATYGISGTPNVDQFLTVHPKFPKLADSLLVSLATFEERRVKVGVNAQDWSTFYDPKLEQAVSGQWHHWRMNVLQEGNDAIVNVWITNSTNETYQIVNSQRASGFSPAETRIALYSHIGATGSRHEIDNIVIRSRAANTPPTLDAISDLVIDEDAGLQTINLSGITSGGDGSQPLRVTASSNNTALLPSLSVDYTSPNATGTLQFTPSENLSGTSIITVVVEDGGSDGNLDTTADNLTFSRVFQVTVNPVNDAPKLINLGNDINYRENVLIARICNAVRLQDVDTSVYINGTLRVAIESGGESADRLWLVNSQYLTVSGSQLVFNGLVVGTYTGGTSGQPLQVAFNSRASINRVQHVLRCVCFAHDSDNPSANQRTVSIQVNDGVGGQLAATKRVNVIPVNDRPMLSGIPASLSYTLNAASVLVAPNAVITDADNSNFAGGQLSIRYVSGQDASNRLLAGGLFLFDAANNLLRNGVIVGQRNASGGIGENNLVVTFNSNATKAVVQELFRSISFQTVGGSSKVSRYLELSLTDGLGGSSDLVTTRIDVV